MCFCLLAAISMCGSISSSESFRWFSSNDFLCICVSSRLLIFCSSHESSKKVKVNSRYCKEPLKSYSASKWFGRPEVQRPMLVHYVAFEVILSRYISTIPAKDLPLFSHVGRFIICIWGMRADRIPDAIVIVKWWKWSTWTLQINEVLYCWNKRLRWSLGYPFWRPPWNSSLWFASCAFTRLPIAGSFNLRIRNDVILLTWTYKPITVKAGCEHVIGLTPPSLCTLKIWTQHIY